MSGLTDTSLVVQSAKRGLMCACAVVLVLSVSSCGRRGSLEAPPGETITTIDDQGNEVKKKKPREDKPFILDPLL